MALIEKPPLRPAAEVGGSAPSTYLPAVDGLRALAVLAVIAYHYGADWAVGGFLGVDVFFVISGFLITLLLLREHGSTGTIRLRSFWSRRLKRLAPALVAMVVGVLVAQRVLGTHPDPGAVRGDALGSLSYVSNWRFVATSSSYFDQYGVPSPLRHTWSLSIEEQWYLIWPALVLGLLVLSKGRRWAQVAAVAVLAAGSAAWMATIFEPGDDPSRVYYGLDTRAQELLVGALLALVVHRRADRARRPGQGEGPTTASVARGVAGLVAASVLGVLMVTRSSLDPWYYDGGLTVAALVAAVLVWACAAPDGPSWTNPVRAALAHPVLVAIGLRSYSLYLWHWPVLVYVNPETVHLSGTALTAARLVVTFALAELSLRLVERPLRRADRLTAWTWVPATALVLVVAFVLVPVAPGAASVGDEAMATAVERGTAAAPEGMAVTGHGPTEVLVVGDSVAFSLGFNYPRGSDLGLVPDGAAMVGCGLIGGAFERDGAVITAPSECADVPGIWADKITGTDPDVVLMLYGPLELADPVVDGRTVEVGSEEYRRVLTARLDEAVDRATSLGARVALAEVPCFGVVAGAEPGIGAERDDPARVSAVNEVFGQVAHARPDDVSLVPLPELLCPDGSFQSHVGDIEMRPDGVHFGPTGAAVTWGWLAPQLHAAARP